MEYSTTLRLSIDDPKLQQDPYAVYRELRAADGLARGGPGQWVASRYDDVKKLLRDPRLGREFPDSYQSVSIGAGPANDFLRRIIIDRDPEEHTRLRRLLNQSIELRNTAQFHDPVASIMDELLADGLEAGSFDAFTDLAMPLPVQIMSELFELPVEDRTEIQRLSHALAKAFAVFIPEEDRKAAHDAVAQLRDYMSELVKYRRQHPGDDLLSRMIGVNHGEQTLSHEEIVDNALFIYYAGYETTANLLATGCAILAERAPVLAELRSDPEVAGTAVEEFLRYDAPIHGTTRLVNETFVHGDQKLRAGRVVVILLAAANHDEAKFENPADVDIRRDPNPHLSFGGGVHHCLGAAIARIEAKAAFLHLSKLVSELELAGEPIWRPAGGGFRFPYCAYESIPVRCQRS